MVETFCDARRGASERAPELRLSGGVQASRSQPVRLNGGGWELLEVVPDGALVEQSQVLARLSSSKWWRDLQRTAFEVEYDAVKARADYDIARISAENDLSKALVAWHDAALDAERA